MYKQKNLNNFELLVEHHSKQKWQKFTISENLNVIKNKNDIFKKKN